MFGKKFVFSILSLFVFIILFVSVSYSYFVYNKEVANIDLKSGDISIDFTNENNNSSTVSSQVMGDSIGKTNPNYLEFTVTGTADTESILYELEIVPNSGNSIDSKYIKYYLTEVDNNNETPLTPPLLYTELFDSMVNNGKGIYQNIVSGNLDGTSKTTIKKYRLRAWIDESYSENSGGNFGYGVYLYAINADSSKYIKVSFNLDDGRGAGLSKYVEKNKEYGSLPKPVNQDRVFLGWKINDNDENYIVESTIVSETTNHTLKAKWVLTTSEYFLENISNQTTCTTTAPNKSSFYGEIDADVIYYTGNDESCLKNYIWYSGKLWRIVAIYPNGMIKLVTENPMTSIYYGSSATFDGSWMDQWLSEEFLPTLYNNENIVVQNGEWNVTETNVYTDPYLLTGSTTITKTVGLLNAFEYVKSGTSSGYLNIGQYWWLIAPYASDNVHYVIYNGNPGSDFFYSEAGSVRPSIYLKSGVVFDVENYDGTRLSPFHIVGDKEEGKTNELLNTRISGEYVKFNNELYRIVGIESNTTKIVNTNYISNPNSSNTSDTTLGNFGSDVYFNTSSTDTSYWDKYLTDTSGWLSTISVSDKSLLVNGTYYLGPYPSSTNYKATICKNTASELETTTISNCMKYESSDTNKTYTGLVGLLRVGEMMSAHQSILTHVNDANHYKSMWLITPYNSSDVRVVYNYGNRSNATPSSSAFSVRPTLHLKSGTKITRGSGFINDPYVIG